MMGKIKPSHVVLNIDLEYEHVDTKTQADEAMAARAETRATIKNLVRRYKQDSVINNPIDLIKNADQLTRTAENFTKDNSMIHIVAHGNTHVIGAGDTDGLNYRNGANTNNTTCFCC